MEKDLLETILITNSLNEAYKRVYKNKGASRVDMMETSGLKKHLK